MTTLLVTNDFPPKFGGIQTYLWELWRRLPTGSTSVLTTRHDGDAEHDRLAADDHGLVVVRDRAVVLLPTPALARRIRARADDVGADLVVLDPALPLGLLGPRLGLPYAVVVHGAEITVPGRLPGLRSALGWVLRGAVGIVAAGGYPASEAERAAGAELPTVVVPPGVDVGAFRPLRPAERDAARRRLGLPVDARLVVGVSRLVPRKGFDTLIRAAVRLAPAHPDLVVAIVGGGRDRRRLEGLVARLGAPVRLLGRLPGALLPQAYGCADAFAMLCRDRWCGLEQEGYGIVFLEAGATAVPSVAGASGGAHEAVEHGCTGSVVDPLDLDAVTSALAALLDDPTWRAEAGAAARVKAEAGSYDLLADRLHETLERWSAGARAQG